MKLFNNRGRIGHNTVLGITIKALLLLFTAENTYAQSYIGPDVGAGTASNYYCISLDETNRFVSRVEGTTSSINATNFPLCSQVQTALLATVIETELDILRDLGKMANAGVGYLAVDRMRYRTMECKYIAPYHACRAK